MSPASKVRKDASSSVSYGRYAAVDDLNSVCFGFPSSLATKRPGKFHSITNRSIGVNSERLQASHGNPHSASAILSTSFRQVKAACNGYEPKQAKICRHFAALEISRHLGFKDLTLVLWCYMMLQCYCMKSQPSGLELVPIPPRSRRQVSVAEKSTFLDAWALASG